eukprot:scaffold1938_cov113-Isochrysis_galbana.AAC.3
MPQLLVGQAHQPPASAAPAERGLAHIGRLPPPQVRQRRRGRVSVLTGFLRRGLPIGINPPDGHSPGLRVARTHVQAMFSRQQAQVDLRHAPRPRVRHGQPDRADQCAG